jgi:hypothetical protein
MRFCQLTGLVLSTAALLLIARSAEAQVWVRPPAPIVVGPAPIMVAPAPVVVGPAWGPRPYWGVRRYYRPFRRAGWYGTAWGPRATWRRW